MQFGNSTLIEPLAEKYDPGFTVSTTIQSGSQHSQPQGQNRYCSNDHLVLKQDVFWHLFQFSRVLNRKKGIQVDSLWGGSYHSLYHKTTNNFNHINSDPSLSFIWTAPVFSTIQHQIKISQTVIVYVFFYGQTTLPVCICFSFSICINFVFINFYRWKEGLSRREEWW